MRRATRRFGTWGLSALLALALLACGEVSDPMPAPQLDNLRVAAKARGEVALNYTLADGSGYPLEITAEYRLENEAWRAASPLGGGAGEGFYAAAIAQDHVFVWDSYRDVGLIPAKAQLRLHARNLRHETWATSPGFELANDNYPPQADIGDFVADENGVATIPVLLRDKEGDPLNLAITVSLDGGKTFFAASIEELPERLASSEEGQSYTLTWFAGQDCAWRERRHVVLRAEPSDELGAGINGLSEERLFRPEHPAHIELLPLARTLREEIPVSFRLFGPVTARFDVSLSFSTDQGQSFRSCRASRSGTDDLSGLLPTPDGLDYLFHWDSLADLGETIQRRLILRAELKPMASVEMLDIASLNDVGINNAPLTIKAMISEICPGVSGEGAFLEISAPPGTDLSRLTLYEKWRKGQTGESLGAAYLPLTGKVGASGFYLVSSPGTDEADQVSDGFDTFFQNVYPYTLILEDVEYQYIFDAVGLGDFASGGYVFYGEGKPATPPPLGQCLAREFSNADLDDNSLDFVTAEATPGEGLLWSHKE